MKRGAKRTTETPSKVGMRFFTPDLYLRSNSPDDRVADEANAEWDGAIEAYRKDLAGLREQLPPAVQKLADACFHDAELFDAGDEVEAMPAWPPGPYWTAYSMMFLRRRDEGIMLVYRLWDAVRQYAASEDWPFSKEQVYWLFDEIAGESGAPRTYWHRVLLSDGRVLEIPFVNVLMRTFSVRRSGATKA